MAKFIAVYSLMNPKLIDQTVLKEVASGLGWNSTITSSRKITYKLPENTFVGTFKDQNSAVESFRQISSKYRLQGIEVKFRKFFIGCVTESDYGSDERS